MVGFMILYLEFLWKLGSSDCLNVLKQLREGPWIIKFSLYNSQQQAETPTTGEDDSLLLL